MPPSEPRISDEPVVTVTDGEAYNLTCTAAFGKPAPTIVWSSNGHTLNSTYTQVSLLPDKKRENVTGVLTIYPDRSYQDQQYECLVISRALNQPKQTHATLDVLCE